MVTFSGLLLEDLGRAPALVPFPNVPPPLYAWLARQPLGVVAEMPIAPAFMLPGDDPRYAYMSTFTGCRRSTGTAATIRRPISDRVHGSRFSRQAPTTELLRRVGVRYVIVHTTAYREGRSGAVLLALR